MSADSFLDSNIIVYIADTRDADKTARAERLIKSGTDYGKCCISRQVIQESLNVAIKKYNYSAEEASELLEETLLPLHRSLDAPALYRRGLDIRYRYRYDLYDSLIIAAALELGCRTLYSENMRRGQTIGRLTIKNPFIQQQ